jgi:pyruvate/2-oxoglutarate dehydrogenase complex dihydrolipoamide dehydrogenase (E3) component
MRVLVLGGGPAGVNAALQARELGAEVTLVEARRVGGTSLNEGPAPVRTLARAARLMRDTQSWGQFGLRGDAPQVDIAAALANADRVANYAHQQLRLAEVVRGQRIDLVEEAGPARLVDPHTVRIPDGRSFGGDAVIVAVGGHAGRLPIPGAELALTYEDVRGLTALPASVAVVGGADTGCQLASILADFGAQVTLVEASPRLVPHADQDVSGALADAFRRRGIGVLTATLVDRLDPAPAGVAVQYRSGSEQARLEVAAVFFAVGWPGNADALGADAVGIATSRGYVQVGADLRSSLPHVLAAGDVNGISMLVPSARHEGRIAAENAVLGTRRQFTHEVVPTGSFTDPEYGSVGLTEAQARERGHEVVTDRFNMQGLGKANIVGEAGMCKVVAEKDGPVLGIHLIGPHVTDLVAEAMLITNWEAMPAEVAALIHPHPTLSEAIGEAHLHLAGKPLHTM